MALDCGKIKFMCPECGTKVLAGFQHEGKKVKCQSCQSLIVVPAANAVDKQNPALSVDKSDLVVGYSALVLFALAVMILVMWGDAIWIFFDLILLLLAAVSFGFSILSFSSYSNRKAFMKSIAHLSPEEQLAAIEERKQRAIEKFQKMREEQKQDSLDSDYGNINEKLICPHCQQKGCVRAKSVTVNKGVHGTKAAAAVLTGGFSILATGLSNKDKHTQAHCANCNSTWAF